MQPSMNKLLINENKQDISNQRQSSMITNSKRISMTKGSTICQQKYMFSCKLGQGTFGSVFIGIHAGDQHVKNNTQVAIKVQSELAQKNSQLLYEGQILRQLHKECQMKGFPKYYASGVELNSTYLVLELLGPNLQDLMKICGGKFTLKTTIILAMQIFERVEILHQHNILYRDVKPENFVMGVGNNSHILHIIDFGLCKKYKDQKTGLHYPYRQDRAIVGTVRYASVNTHLGIEQSRRDDLQSICYMIIYFLKGKLPWQGAKSDRKIEKQHLIMQKKLKMSIKELCEDIPFQIQNIMSYCKNLSFYENPEYSYIKNELKSLFNRCNFIDNFNYDWVLGSGKQRYITNILQIQLEGDGKNGSLNDTNNQGNKTITNKDYEDDEDDDIDEELL